jgi:hypothetical protein
LTIYHWILDSNQPSLFLYYIVSSCPFCPFRLLLPGFDLSLWTPRQPTLSKQQQRFLAKTTGTCLHFCISSAVYELNTRRLPAYTFVETSANSSPPKLRLSPFADAAEHPCRLSGTHATAHEKPISLVFLKAEALLSYQSRYLVPLHSTTPVLPPHPGTQQSIRESPWPYPTVAFLPILQILHPAYLQQFRK